MPAIIFRRNEVDNKIVTSPALAYYSIQPHGP